MKLNQLKPKTKKCLFNLVVILLIVAFAVVINCFKDDPINNIFSPSRPKSVVSVSVSNPDNTYSASMDKENARYKVVTDAITKKYDDKLKALQDKTDAFTAKGETNTTEYHDTVSDHLIMMDKKLVEVIQEDIKHTQNTRKIYDRYNKPKA